LKISYKPSTILRKLGIIVTFGFYDQKACSKNKHIEMKDNATPQNFKEIDRCYQRQFKVRRCPSNESSV